MSLSLIARWPWASLVVVAMAEGGCVSERDVPTAGLSPVQASDGAAAADRRGDGALDRTVVSSPEGSVPAPAPAADAAAPGWDHPAIGESPTVAVPGACRQDDDCRLIDDCCSCAAVPGGQTAPACDRQKSCLTTTCAQYGGVERARCVGGRCIVGFNCQTGTVRCNRPRPVCPPGQTPLALGSREGRCYGECVDARQCMTVPACSVCAPGDLCLRTAGADDANHCVGWPEGCHGPASCACGGAACGPPFGACMEGDTPAAELVCDRAL
jgi:hypothetical protein